MSVIEEKQAIYQISNSYSTLNQRKLINQQVWFVCHGLGYLSRYFIGHFANLDPSKHFIIAPQASSKYYLDESYSRVGASWLTKENTKPEIQNVLNYFDQIKIQENLSDREMNILGFSQGVSVALRWTVQRQIACKKLIIYAGKVPLEIKPAEVDFLLKAKTQIYHVHGTQDPYLKYLSIPDEKKYLDHLFKGTVNYLTFDGGHGIDQNILRQISY